MIRTESGSLYTGVTTDVERRLCQHQRGKGAKHLKGKGVLTVVYQVCVGDRSTALRLEYQIKRLNKQNKERLVENQPDLSSLLALIFGERR